MSAATVSIGKIVRDMMVEDDRSSMHKYQQLLQIAIRGVREMNIDITHTIKSVLLSIDPDLRTADLPEDFIDYSKIGIEVNGQLVTLSVNNDISLLKRTDSCGNLEAPVGNGRLAQYYNDSSLSSYPGVYFYNVYNSYGQFTGRMYGQGSGLNPVGYYRLDYARRQIMFSTVVDVNNVVMEYLSNGLSSTECILVPETAYETLISWIQWKTSKGAQREQYKSEYFRNRDWLKMREFSFTVYEMVDAVRRGIQQSVKS